MMQQNAYAHSMSGHTASWQRVNGVREGQLHVRRFVLARDRFPEVETLAV